MGEISLSQELLNVLDVDVPVHVLALEVPHAEAEDVCLGSFIIEFQTAAVVEHG